MERLAHTPELLDGPLDPTTLRGNLRDLARVNRWLGGVALSRHALVALLTGFHARPQVGGRDWRDTPVRMLDVGTGGADLPEALIDWTAQHGIRLSVEAVDERDEILDDAYERIGERPDLHLERSVGEVLAYADASFDVAHCSMVIHHLEPEHAVDLLAEMTRVSTIGVIVNDLDRSRLAEAGAWLLAHTMTGNAYTRHDAPLSVRRSYRPSEIAQLAMRAGLTEVGRYHGYLGHRYALAFRLA